MQKAVWLISTCKLDSQQRLSILTNKSRVFSPHSENGSILHKATACICFLQSTVIFKVKLFWSSRTLFEVGFWLSLLLYNQTEREGEESSASLKKILGFKRFPVFWPAVRVCSSQRTDNAQNYSTEQHVLHLSKFSLASLIARAHTTPPVEKVVRGSSWRQEDAVKCLSGFPWLSKAEWKTVELENWIISQLALKDWQERACQKLESSLQVWALGPLPLGAMALFGSHLWLAPQQFLDRIWSNLLITFINPCSS